MTDICKGKISTIEAAPVDKKGHPTTARVFSLTGGSVTRPLIIPWYLRGTMGNLAPDTEVVFVLFEDKTGYILGRFDGEFQDYIPYDVIIDGNETVNGDETVNGNVIGNDFVSNEYGSTNQHTHTDSQGGNTTAPN